MWCVVVVAAAVGIHSYDHNDSLLYDQYYQQTLQLVRYLPILFDPLDNAERKIQNNS
jgi:hypothetical protein